MRSSRALALAIVASALVGCAVATAADTPKLVYLDYNGQASVKPRTIFLSANAGPRLAALKWTGWGTAKATAKGRYVSDCASCVRERADVTVTFRTIRTCDALGVRTYATGSYRVAKTKGHRARTVKLDPGVHICTLKGQPDPPPYR